MKLLRFSAHGCSVKHYRECHAVIVFPVIGQRNEAAQSLDSEAMTTEKLLTLKQAAAETGRSYQELWTLCKAGKIRYHRKGVKCTGAYLIKLEWMPLVAIHGQPPRSVLGQ